MFNSLLSRELFLCDALDIRVIDGANILEYLPVEILGTGQVSDDRRIYARRNDSRDLTHNLAEWH